MFCDNKKREGCPVWGLIKVLVVLAAIGVAIYAAYRFFSPSRLEEFEDDFGDEFEDDFEEEETLEQKAAEEKPEDAELEACEPVE